MGMRVGGAASSAAAAAWQSRRQDFASLATAIKGGDLTAAQQAFAKLAGTAGAAASSPTCTPSLAPTDQSPITAIGQALSSGDIKGAQEALAKLFAGAGHGHHHHHSGGQQVAAPPSSTTTLPPGTSISLMA